MMNKNKPRVGVGGLVLDESKENIVLQLRKKDPEANHWGMPGGTVEYKEVLTEALQRELEEEIGTKGTVHELLCISDHIGEEYHWVSPAYLVTLDSEQKEKTTNNSGDESYEIAWFSLKKLPEKLTVNTKNALASYYADGSK